MSAAPAIIFDTDCLLCSGIVRFVLRHERDRALRFAGAWSEEGLALAARHGFSRADLNATFLVIAEGRALTRSDAAFAILGHLRAPWPGSGRRGSCRALCATGSTTSWPATATACSADRRIVRSCRPPSGAASSA